MLAVKHQALTNSFLGFASEASNVLHISSEKDYQDAIETIEYLFDQAVDSPDEPLNDLIELLSRSIESYESNLEDIINFDNQADDINQEISVLRVLMTQYHLTVSSFKDEIGTKSLVSMILNGKRNLTKEHIIKLSKRFNLNPALFFDLKLA